MSNKGRCYKKIESAKFSSSGYFALIDIVMFGMIIILASSVPLYALNQTSQNLELSNDRMLMERSDQILSVLLRTTLDSEFYGTTNTAMGISEIGTAYALGYKPISELLAEALYFRSCTSSQIDLNWPALETFVYGLLENLTFPELGFNFQSRMGTAVFSISSIMQFEEKSSPKEQVKADRTFNFTLYGQMRTVYFNLGIWRL